MGISDLFNFTEVADIAELKTLGSQPTGKLIRVLNDRRIVKDAGNGFINNTYFYDPASTLTEELPAIVEPSDTNGRYIMANPVFFVSAIPSSPPAIANSTAIVSLTTPNRTLVYKAFGLSDPPVVADWKLIKTPIVISTAPTFAPDYQGQIVIDSTTGIEYLADGQDANSGSWLPRGLIYGGAITGAKTIGLGDRNRWFTFANGATITLPDNPGKQIEFELIGDPITATATLSVTNATLIGNSSVTGVAKVRSDGTSWYRF